MKNKIQKTLIITSLLLTTITFAGCGSGSSTPEAQVYDTGATYTLPGSLYFIRNVFDNDLVDYCAVKKHESDITSDIENHADSSLYQLTASSDESLLAFTLQTPSDSLPQVKVYDLATSLTTRVCSNGGNDWTAFGFTVANDWLWWSESYDAIFPATSTYRVLVGASSSPENLAGSQHAHLSPDSSHFLYSPRTGYEVNEITFAGATSDAAIVEGRWPTWNQAGTHFCFIDSADQLRIASRSTPGTGIFVAYVGAQAGKFSWSPDGNSIAYIEKQVFVVNAQEHSDTVLLSAGSVSSNINEHTLCWSPDSKWVAWIGKNTIESSNNRLFVTPAAGGNSMDLTGATGEIDDNWPVWR